MNFVNVPANFRLIPGMTLSGDVKVGRRTLASYVWETLARGAGEAMREP
jgi:HlyD family secretion protein